MAIVPIYLLRASSSTSEGERRYRFSREPTPDPNPHPGEHDEDSETKWIVEGVAFYAWSDQMDNGELRAELQPVYEFHRCAWGRHQYYYSLESDAPKGWKRRPYVSFWAHAEDVEDGAPAVHRFRQDGLKRDNFALGVDREIEGWTREEKPVFYASERVPVQVSVRSDGRKRRGYDWTFEPSTVNLAYGSILEFVPAPRSDFAFTGFDVVKGDDDFDAPLVEPGRVQVRARCSSRGKDYKYNVRVRVGSSSQEITGDPEIVNQAPTKL
jgi:hypothetical protein